MRKAELSKDDFKKIAKATSDLEDLNLFIDDNPMLTIATGRQDLLFSPKTNAQTTLAALNRENNSELRRFQVADPDEVTGFGVSGRQKSALWIHKWQERHDASTLHSVREVTLLFCRQASEATRKNFAALSDEFLQQIGVLVINRITGLDRRQPLFKEGGRHGIGESVEVG